MEPYDFDKAMGTFESKFDNMLEQAANRYRNEVLIPYCKKYRLRFTSGMGSFFFTAASGKILNDCYMPEGCLLREDFDRLFEQLNTPLGYAQANALGLCICDFDGRPGAEDPYYIADPVVETSKDLHPGADK